MSMLPNSMEATPARSMALRIAFVAVWVAIVAIGWVMHTNYEFTPARNAHPPTHWPAQSKLERGHGPTLIVFLHAYCPCSRATLRELEKFLAEFPSDGNAFCVVSYPDMDDVEPSDLVAMARQIPRLQLRSDNAADEVDLFGITASGTVLYYDAQGTLRFSGGITSARGHEGANPGIDALLSMIEKGRPTSTSTPVFGCTLPSRSHQSLSSQASSE